MQPIITKKLVLKTIVLNLLIMIIPFGIVYVIVMMISEFTKTRMAVYEEKPIRKRDKRYKEGYRIEGWKRVKTRKKRELSTEEIAASRFNGNLRLIAFVLFFIIGGMIYYFDLKK